MFYKHTILFKSYKGNGFFIAFTFSLVQKRFTDLILLYREASFMSRKSLQPYKRNFS